MKNDETNKWERKPFYNVEEKFPIGHGEKSLFIINHFIRITNEEAMCVRWHMGAYEPKESYMSLARAKELYPNILWTHIADELEATETKMLRAVI